MSDLLFQAMHASAEAHTVKHEATSAIGEIVKWSLGKIGDYGTELHVEDELRRLGPEIQSKKPKGGGVLIRVGLMEWAILDFMEDRAQHFMDIAIVGAGMDSNSALNQYEQTPQLLASPPDGWRRRDTFMWVTAPEHQEEVKPHRLE